MSDSTSTSISTYYGRRFLEVYKSIFPDDLMVKNNCISTDIENALIKAAADLAISNKLRKEDRSHALSIKKYEAESDEAEMSETGTVTFLNS